MASLRDTPELAEHIDWIEDQIQQAEEIRRGIIQSQEEEIRKKEIRKKMEEIRCCRWTAFFR